MVCNSLDCFVCGEFLFGPIIKGHRKTLRGPAALAHSAPGIFHSEGCGLAWQGPVGAVAIAFIELSQLVKCDGAAGDDLLGLPHAFADITKVCLRRFL